MKKMIFCLTGLVFLSAGAGAQNWSGPGAVWHYGRDEGSYRTLVRMEYISDTLILGRPCMRLEVESHLWYLQYPPPSEVYTYQGGSSGETYLSISGDTVFWFRGNIAAFSILFNFSAQPGDSWDLQLEGDTACGPGIVSVTDAGITVINGDSLRWIELETDQNSGAIFNGRVNEKFGFFGSGLSPHTLFPVMNACPMTVDYFYYRFLCYEDEEFSMYNISGFTDCYRIRTLSSPAVKDMEGMDFYMDNVSGILNYSVSRNDYKTIRILDMGGRSMMEIHGNPAVGEWHHADVSELTPGIYILSVSSESAYYSAKFLVTQK